MAEDTMTVMEFVEDISEAEAPEPLPPGEYPATIRGAEVKESQSGNHYVAVQFMIQPDDYPADYPAENAPDGKIVTFRRLPYSQDKGAMYRMRKFCESIGAATSKRIDVNDWIGLEATVRIEHDTWEGEKREQIAAVTAA